jgi:hypothetical protein
VARTPDVRALEEPAVAVVLPVYWDGTDVALGPARQGRD